MEYSNIKTLKINNFCGIENGEISFEESPIICLTGENGVGKTCIIDAFSVIGRDKAIVGKLNELVQQNKGEFKLECELEDNTKIIREKGKKNKCKVIDKNGEVVLNVEKIDRGYEIKEVTDRMGFWEEEESKQCLQTRSFHEPLLFAETKDSDNYKIFYKALNVDNILKGIKCGNGRCNEIKGVVRDEIAKKKGLLEMQDKIKVVEEEKIEKLKEIQQKIKRYNEIENVINELKVLKSNTSISEKKKIPPKVSKICLYMRMVLTLRILNKIHKTKRIYIDEFEEIMKYREKNIKIRAEQEKLKKELSEIKIICPHCKKEI